MKILKQGHRKETAEVFCKTCHSLLEITKEDVKEERYYTDIDYYIFCPVCGQHIGISPAELFPWVD